MGGGVAGWGVSAGVVPVLDAPPPSTHKRTHTHPPTHAQASGGALVAHATRLSTAADVQENLARAATALKAARGVLEECLAAGRLISQQRLYHALCSLDTIRRKHLGARVCAWVCACAHITMCVSGGGGEGVWAAPPTDHKQPPARPLTGA